MQVQFQFDQDSLVKNLFCFGRNGGAVAASNFKATFVQANILCKFVLPPQSHSIRKSNSYAIQSWDVVRYAKKVTGRMAGPAAAPVKTELRYVTLNEAPNLMMFRVAPVAAYYPAGVIDHGGTAEQVAAHWAKSKKPNMEITKIDMSINTSSTTLQ